MRIVIAIIIGLTIFGFGFGSMRGLARPRGGSASAEPEPLDPMTRQLWWCENCGAEVLVVLQGNGYPFRHCGEKMHRREEAIRDSS